MSKDPAELRDQLADLAGRIVHLDQAIDRTGVAIELRRGFVATRKALEARGLLIVDKLAELAQPTAE